MTLGEHDHARPDPSRSEGTHQPHGLRLEGTLNAVVAQVHDSHMTTTTHDCRLEASSPDLVVLIGLSVESEASYLSTSHDVTWLGAHNARMLAALSDRLRARA